MQNVIGIGELLWDVFPNGKKLGGAPCNFVYHAQKQGAKGFPISAIGNDANGVEILKVLKEKSISSDLIQINHKPTSTVDVLLNRMGIPEYRIHENVAWDFIELNKEIAQKVIEACIVCFGTLAQRNSVSGNSIAQILELFKLSNPEALIVFDINLRQNFYSRNLIQKSLDFCNVLKLNEDELPIVCKLLNIEAKGEERQIHQLIKNYNLKLAVFTKGGDSSLLMTPHETSLLKTPKTEIKDTVGAGDSFTASVAINFANKLSIKEIHQKSVDIAAFVCSQEGAMPEY